MLTITDIRVALKDDPKLRATVAITLEHDFLIRGIKVVQGDEGFFVAMPSRRRPEGGYTDVCAPISAALRQVMEAQILDAFHREHRRDDPGGAAVRSPIRRTPPRGAASRPLPPSPD